MPSFVSNGTFVASAASVANPTTLTPTNPTRSTGDRLFALTSCTSPSATVAESGDWSLVFNVIGATLGRLAAFSRIVDGLEAAASITWSSLNTGTSGTPCCAQTTNLGTGFLESGGDVVVDVLSGVSEQAGSSTLNAGGAAFTTLSHNTFLIAQGVRIASSTFSGVADTDGIPVTWTNIQGMGSTSGTDMAHFASIGTGPAYASLITAHTWTLTGAALASSTGVMVALQTPTPFVPSEPGALTYTRGAVRG